MIVGFTGTKEIKGEPRESAIHLRHPSKTKSVCWRQLSRSRSPRTCQTRGLELIRQVKVTQ